MEKLLSGWLLSPTHFTNTKASMSELETKLGLCFLYGFFYLSQIQKHCLLFSSFPAFKTTWIHVYTRTHQHNDNKKKVRFFFQPSSHSYSIIFYVVLYFILHFGLHFCPPLIQLLIRVIAINSATKRIFFCSFFFNCSMSCIIGLWNSSFISNWWYMSVVEMEIFDNTVNTYAVLFEWATTTTTSTKQIIINIQRNFSYDVDVDAIHNGM